MHLDGPRQNRIREILFTGDFVVTPPRVIMDLESELRGVLLQHCADEIAAFLARTNVGTLSVTASDFAAAITVAVARA